MDAVLSWSSMPWLIFFLTQKKGQIKISTFGTFLFKTFVKVIQNATSQMEAEMKMCAASNTNMTLQK